MMPIVFLTAFAVTQADTMAQTAYTIVPVSGRDRTALHVTVRMRIPTGESIETGLPQDCYGTPDIHQAVRDWSVDRGTAVPDSTGLSYRLAPDAEGILEARYVLSYDPAVLAGFPFAPNVGPGHFHVAGCQWLLRPADRDARRRHVIRILGDSTWHLYSSIAADPRVVDTMASYRDLLATAIGGNRRPPFSFTIRGKPLAVFVQGEYTVARDALANAIATIVTRERDWFRDHSESFYTVTVLPRPGRLAGTARPNLFVCFVSGDRLLDEVLTLVAHETTHNWLPNRMELAIPEGDMRLRFQWLNEGVADYVGRTLLLGTGLMSEERFVELVNADLVNLAGNPFAAATYPERLAVARTGRTGGPFFRLPYNRGALMALRWDHAFRTAGKTEGLRDFLGELLAVAKRAHGTLNEDTLFAVAARRGIDARGDFARYVLGGAELDVPRDLLDGKYALETVPIPTPFDPGFALQTSRRQGKVTGVRVGGPADAAGLRDGMDIVRIENGNLFSPSWRSGLPLRVTVRSNGVERDIDVVPAGEPKPTRVYRRSRALR